MLNSLENDAPRLERAALLDLLDHVTGLSRPTELTAQVDAIRSRYA